MDSSSEYDVSNVKITTTVYKSPDGGYGWVIVVACFILQMMVPGMISVFGVFLPEFLDYFGSLRGETALTGSIMSSCITIPGPFISILVNLIGCRAVAIMGAILTTSGLLLSTQVSNVLYLTITMGLISGIGLACIYMSFIVSVGFWFDKHRAIAMGITTSGGGIGVMVLGTYSAWLLNRYDWKNALVFIGAITIQAVVCGALLRPSDIQAQVSSENKTSNEEFTNNYNIEEIKNNQAQFCSTHSIISLQSAKNYRIGNTPILHSVNDGTSTSSPLIIRRYPHLSPALFISLQDIPGSIVTKDIHTQSCSSSNPHNPLLIKDVHKFKFEAKCNEIPKIVGTRKSGTEIQGIFKQQSAKTSIDECRGEGGETKSKTAQLKKMLGITILTNVPFIIILICNALFQTAFVMCLCFVTDYGISIGLSLEHAAHIITAFGIGTTVGRIVAGAVTAIPAVGPVQATSASLLFAGLFSFSIVLFCKEFWSLAICVGMTGFCLAPIIPLSAVMQVDYLGLDNLINSQGMISLGKGVVSLFGPPAAGLLQDWTGSPTPPFYITGFILVLAGFLQATLLMFNKKAVSDK